MYFSGRIYVCKGGKRSLITPSPPPYRYKGSANTGGWGRIDVCVQYQPFWVQQGLGTGVGYYTLYVYLYSNIFR